MSKIGFAVIGTKGMGRGHIKAVLATEGFELRGVCDVMPAESEACAKEFNVQGYTDVKAMLKADPQIKAVSIATPHWYHPPIAVECAKHKVHVVTEKPMSVTVSGADQMIAAHKKSKTILAVVYQARFQAANAKMKELVASGVLGKIHRVMLLAPGYRTNAYYASGGWRATWKGEGGGVLLNQAPHDLDQLQWIAGEMPSQVVAVNESVLHPIEVEDRASALLTYKGGATGYLHVSTTEVPGRNVIEFAGDKGYLRLEDGKLHYAKIDPGIREWTENTKEAWSRPKVAWEEIALEPPAKKGHEAVFQDFYEAIVNKRAPKVTGEDGRNSVELANGMILSSFTKKPAKFPVSRKAYDALMKKLIAKSKKRI
ncbi:MAG: Gfo/Idh/MocA family oxidoreductase [Planctomycetota bacterium]|nr:Gfo/Idh/MocA family oxidoreductase [Planctomycetota bacterium]